jgi:hypothetical protein
MARLPMLGDNGYVVSPNLQATFVDPHLLRPLGRAAREHSQSQIRKIAGSLTHYGFRMPVLVDAQGRVVAGWGLVLAAIHLKLRQVPVITITDLKETELRALRLAMNKLGEGSDWVPEELSLEFKDIFELDSNFDIKLSGFEMGEIDRLTLGGATDEEDEFLPEVATRATITKLGDLWVLEIIRSSAATLAIARVTRTFWAAHSRRWSLPIHPTTSQLKETSQVWGSQSTASSRWRPAKCLTPNIQAS